MKRLFPLYIFTLFLSVSCGKNSSNNNESVYTPLPPLPYAPPLPNTMAKTDTLNVLAYNVLNYGDACQGTINTLNIYFRTIVQYLQPDILSCEKMFVFDPDVTMPANLAEDITDSVLNVALPNKFAYAIPTNVSDDDAMSCLFYNTQKLTFVKTELLFADVSDFDMYELYYNDINLAITHDTTFLYIAVNHTQSGSSSTIRDQQEAQEMQILRAKFNYFPNLIILGDFNTNNSSESGYQAIISNQNQGTQMSDPPFYPDRKYSYPADWTNYPSSFASCLTTSTRQLSNVPNSCGTDGGAKSWYDHIFISPWLIDTANYIAYIANSYQTAGNDGNRVGISVNSTQPVLNTSAPNDVINALFQFSNKYPVSIKLSVKANRNAVSYPDPIERN